MKLATTTVGTRSPLPEAGPPAVGPAGYQAVFGVLAGLSPEVGRGALDQLQGPPTNPTSCALDPRSGGAQGGPSVGKGDPVPQLPPNPLFLEERGTESPR